MFLVVLWLALASFAMRVSGVQADVAPPRRASFVVLPVVREGELLEPLRQRGAQLEQALIKRGLSAVGQGNAAALFQTRHSREPHDAGELDLEDVQRTSEQARLAAADRETEEAKQHAESVRRMIAGRLESANRDDQLARAVFAACWAHVRALVSEGDRPAALAVARRCKADVPDLEPSLRDNPPSVMRVFDELKHELASARGARLDVDSAPPGCRVLANGRLWGTTPFSQRVPQDQQYALQVDCGDGVPPRVHDVSTDNRVVLLTVDSLLERSVRTSGGPLRLVYPRSDDPLIESHARAVAGALGAEEVFLLTAGERGTVRVQRLGGIAVVLGDARAPMTLAQAVDALLRPRPEQPSADLAAGGRGVAREGVPGPRRRGAWLIPTGVVLAGTGAILGAVGGWRYRVHRADGDDFEGASGGDYAGAGTRWQESRTAPYVFMGIGAGLATAGAIMLTEPLSASVRRWLSPLMLVAGAGILARGIVDLRQGALCAKYGEDMNLRECVDDEEQLDRGGLLTIASIPFLAVATVHFGEWLWHSSKGRSRRLGLYLMPRSAGASLRF